MELFFTSDRFRPYLPESAQVNPGVHGFELALHLSQRLMARGIVTSYPMSEDWVLFIERHEGDAELMIACSSDGPGEWRVGIEPAAAGPASGQPTTRGRPGNWPRPSSPCSPRTASPPRPTDGRSPSAGACRPTRPRRVHQPRSAPAAGARWATWRLRAWAP